MSRDDVGNGDFCPGNSEHGRMYVLKSNSQYCAHTAHLGNPKRAPGGATPPSRAVWPLGHDSFAAAVREWQGAQ